MTRDQTLCWREALARAGILGPGSRFAHAGLILDRYLGERDGQGQAQRRLLAAAPEAAGRARDLYEEAFTRFEETVCEAVTRRFKVKGRLVTGLGRPSPLEVGLRLHHTYGTPLIPGSGLKGLAAHYCHTVWGERDPEFRREVELERESAATDEAGGDIGRDGRTKRGKRPGDHYAVLFGSTEDAGHVIFHDAWIVPESLTDSLVLDVMTVHHPDYYAGKAEAAPTDFDEPTPVPFLSVRGTFLVALEADEPGPEARRWAELAMTLLAEALANWGAGGKTSTGYGRMVGVAGGNRVQAAPAGPGDLSIALSPAAPSPRLATVKPPTHRSPTLRRGDIVRVRRVEDPKGKDRLWFRMVDGDGEGTLLEREGGTPIEVGLGEEAELGVYSVGETVNFAWPDAPAFRRGKGGGPGRDGRARREPGPPGQHRRGGRG